MILILSHACDACSESALFRSFANSKALLRPIPSYIVLTTKAKTATRENLVGFHVLKHDAEACVQTCVVEPKAFSLVVMQLHRAVAAAAAEDSLSSPTTQTGIASSLHQWLEQGGEAPPASVAGGHHESTGNQKQATSAMHRPDGHRDSSKDRASCSQNAQGHARWGGEAAVLSQAELLAALAGRAPTAHMIAERGRVCASLDTEQVRCSKRSSDRRAQNMPSFVLHSCMLAPA